MDIGDVGLGKGLAPEVLTRPRVLQHRRINLLLLAGGVVALLIFVGIITPLMLLRNEDAEHARVLAAAEQLAAEDVGSHFRNAIIDAVAATGAMKGFLSSDTRVLPNLSDPPMKRLEGQSFPRFQNLAASLAAVMPGLALLLLAPGGVFLETYPPDTSVIGRDMFNPDDPTMAATPTPVEVMRSGVVAVAGPILSTTPPMMGQWAMVVYQPVFNLTTDPTPVQSEFWGFVSSLTNISGVMQRWNLAESFEAAQMDYLLYGTAPNESTFVVMTSLHNPSPAEVAAFILAGTGHERFLPTLNFSIVVQSRHRRVLLSSQNVAVVVCVAVFCALLLYAVAATLIVVCTEHYTGTHHAPKLAPFAMATLGIAHSEEMWSATPVAMGDFVVSLLALIRRHARACHVFFIGQQRPYTISFTARTPDALLRLSFDVLEDLQRHRQDRKLRDALSKAGFPHLSHPVMLSCAVHWCTDAAVLVDPSSGGYAYVGPDVDLATRLFTFAAPNTVTVTAKTKGALGARGARGLAFQCLGSGGQTPAGKHGLTGGTTTTTTNSSNTSDEKAGGGHLDKDEASHLQDRIRRASRGATATQPAGKQTQPVGPPHHESATTSTLATLAPPPNASTATSESRSLATRKTVTAARGSSSESEGDSSFTEEVEAVILYTVTDPTRHRLQEASATAADVLRRVEEARQQQRHATQPSAAEVAGSGTCAFSARGPSPQPHPALSEEERRQRRKWRQRARQEAQRAREARRRRLPQPLVSLVAEDGDTTREKGSGGAHPTARPITRQRCNNKEKDVAKVGGSGGVGSTGGSTAAGSDVDDSDATDTFTSGSSYTYSFSCSVSTSGNEEEDEMERGGVGGVATSAGIGTSAGRVNHRDATLSDSEERVLRCDRLAHQVLPMVSPPVSIFGSSSSSGGSGSGGSNAIGADGCREAKEKHRADDGFSNDDKDNNDKSKSGEWPRPQPPPAADGAPSPRAGRDTSSRTPTPDVVGRHTKRVRRRKHIHRRPADNTAGGRDAEAREQPAAAGAFPRGLGRQGRVSGVDSLSSSCVRVDVSMSAGADSLRSQSSRSAQRGRGVDKRHTTVKADQINLSRYDMSAAAAFSTTGPSTLMVAVEEDDAIARLLIHPTIPTWLDASLRIAFESQSIAVDIEYDAVRVVVFFFYCSTRLLFHPLATVERENILKRLVSAFGVPLRDTLENLSARCVIRYMQQHEEAKSLFYDYHLKEQEQQQFQRTTSHTPDTANNSRHRAISGGSHRSPTAATVASGLVSVNVSVPSNQAHSPFTALSGAGRGAASATSHATPGGHGALHERPLPLEEAGAGSPPLACFSSEASSASR